MIATLDYSGIMSALLGMFVFVLAGLALCAWWVRR